MQALHKMDWYQIYIWILLNPQFNGMDPLHHGTKPPLHAAAKSNESKGSLPSLHQADLQYPARTQSFVDNRRAQSWRSRQTPTTHVRLPVPVLPVHHHLHEVAPQDEVRYCRDPTFFTFFQLVEIWAPNPKPGPLALERSFYSSHPSEPVRSPVLLDKLYLYCVDIVLLFQKDIFQASHLSH